jgi:hypothetical protein
MKKILLICLLFNSIAIYSQNIEFVKTSYSKIEGGEMRKENFTFSLSNGTISIDDLGYNVSEKYHYLILKNSGYDDEGHYFLYYSPAKSPSYSAYRRTNGLKAYKFYFDKKGGELLIIMELKKKGNSDPKVKRYFTKEGYKSVSENNILETNFDIKGLITESKTLNDLMNRINFSFEQQGDKKKSDDGQFVTVKYDNGGTVFPIVTYTKTGTVHQIIFLIPKTESDNIFKELISEYGTKEINGEELVKRDNLTYNYRADGDVGILVIK